MPSKRDQQNFWSFYPSEPFKNGHFNVRHPVFCIKSTNMYVIVNWFYLFVTVSDKATSNFFWCRNGFSLRLLLHISSITVNQSVAFVAKAAVLATLGIFCGKLLNFQRFHLQNVKRHFSKTKLHPTEVATFRAGPFWVNIERRCLFRVHDSEK